MTSVMAGRVRPRPLVRRPSVSVLVPCYNYGRFLPDAVGSVLTQPDVDVDVLIVDDASPDGSGEVADALAAADPRVRVIRHETNRGHIATYNEGLDALEGEYTVLLDADDMLTPGALGRATALMEAHPTVGMVYGHPLQYRDERPPAVSTVRSWSVWTGDEWLDRRCRRGTNCIFAPEVVMRGSVQREIGGYDPELPHSGDLEMWLRAAAVADVGRVNGASQAWYRIHGESMQRTIYTGAFTDLQERDAAFASCLVGPGSRVRNGEALYATARRAMATEALDRACRAYDEGRTDVEPVDDYIALARRLHPEVERLRPWAGLERRRRAGAEAARRGPAVAARRGVRDLSDRVRWRRWRWSGT